MRLFTTCLSLVSLALIAGGANADGLNETSWSVLVNGTPVFAGPHDPINIQIPSGDLEIKWKVVNDGLLGGLDDVQTAGTLYSTGNPEGSAFVLYAGANTPWNGPKPAYAYSSAILYPAQPSRVDYVPSASTIENILTGQVTPVTDANLGMISPSWANYFSWGQYQVGTLAPGEGIVITTHWTITSLMVANAPEPSSAALGLLGLAALLVRRKKRN